MRRSFGGTNGFQWFNDVWCYDPAQNAWTGLDCIGYIPAPREGHAAAIVDDVMYIFGGRTEEGTDLGDLAAFRITTRRWYTFQNMGPSPSPRSGHSMTAHGKNVVVLAGEPSTATDVQDLAIVYLLDTSKIRYPNDQQIQQTPTGERVGGRRPSTSDKGIPGPTSRSGSALDHNKPTGPARESILVSNAPPARSGQPPATVSETSTTSHPETAAGHAPGSKLPRASVVPAPGPPPQQAVPTPRANNAVAGTSRGQPAQAKPERAIGPSVDTTVGRTTHAPVQSSRAISPAPKQVGPSTKDSPSDPVSQAKTMAEAPRVESTEPTTTLVNGVPRSSSKTRTARQPGSVDSNVDSSVKSASIRQTSPPPTNRQVVNPLARKNSKRNSQTVALLKELDAAKNRNAWYASELELARKSGYTPNPSASPALDQRTADSFDDEDKPLVEALLAMRAELANVQASVDKQAIVVAKQIAEVEKQRDAAVNEAVYAKAKLAAHGGSQNSTPQPDSDGRDVGFATGNRSTDISKKLAGALQMQRDLKTRLEILTSKLEAEKSARSLADDTALAAQARIADLETYKQNNSSEVERLRAELHESQREARETAILCAEAVSAAQLLRLEKQDLDSRHREILGNSKDQSETFASLRDAIAASTSRGNLLDRKLEEERAEREKIESKLTKLKTEHELQTAELEAATRRLRDAEELAESHAAEAQKHKQAVLSGLDKAGSRDINTRSSIDDERALALQAQLQTTNGLVRKYQQAADVASEKLRSAEERIAGLEAIQEQVSREGMSIRKQLQGSMREIQSLQAGNQDLKHQLSSQQLETNAALVQHNTLKEILTERGISPTGALRARGLSSPSSSKGGDALRLRELEQQLATTTQSHEDSKRQLETQAQESERAYREKLTQLESDYQSAVHYVKGTEKMLKRMKEELAKYKNDNTRLKDQLVEAEDKVTGREAPASWETERATLNKQIESLQADIKSSVLQLETQMAQVRTELTAAQHERDFLKTSQVDTQRQLSSTMERSAQLQHENAQLEKRAHDAENKVSLLLNQVENSVDNYRRQSRQPDGTSSGAATVTAGHSRNLSGADSVSESETSMRDRNSMALDSLASELETLRTHWETTRDKGYGNRMSGAFDFEDLKTPKFGEDLGFDSGEWRRRLGEETETELETDDERERERDLDGEREQEREPLKITPAIGRDMGVGLGKENDTPTHVSGRREMNGSEVTPTKGHAVLHPGLVNVI